MIASNLGQVIGRAVTPRAKDAPKPGTLGPVERLILATLRRYRDLSLLDLLELEPAIFGNAKSVARQRSMLLWTLAKLRRRGFVTREGKPRSYTYTARGPLNLDWLGLLP
jgi:hypothetical protein